MRKFIKGFTLIEFGLVLFLSTLLLYFLVPMWRDYQLDVKKANLMNQHLDQFRMLTNAASNWSGTTYADIADNSSGVVSVAALKTGNYLPTHFAYQYTTSIPYDILGYEYKVYWNKQEIEYQGVEKQRVRMLIVADSPLDWQSHPQIFVPSMYSKLKTQDEYLSFVSGWYSELANKATNKNLVAGTIRANSNQIIGVNQTFSFVLKTADFSIPQKPFDRVVFFDGWPDINDLPNENTGTGGTEELVEQYSECVVGTKTQVKILSLNSHGNLHIGNSTSPPTYNCPSGHKILVDLTPESGSSPIAHVPGWGSLFGSIKPTIVSSLGVYGGGCYNTAYNYCRAKYGYSNCNTQDRMLEIDAHTKSCNVTPITRYETILNIGGAEYASYNYYEFGVYNLGTVSGTRYMISTHNPGTQYTVHRQSPVLCCPNDVPDL